MKNKIFYITVSLFILSSCGLLNKPKFENIDDEQTLMGFKLGEYIYQAKYGPFREENDEVNKSVPGELWYNAAWRGVSLSVLNDIPSELKGLSLDSKVSVLVDSQKIIAIMASIHTTDLNEVEDAFKALYGMPTDKNEYGLVWKGLINTLTVIKNDNDISIRLKNNSKVEAARVYDLEHDGKIEEIRGFRNIILGSDISENINLIRVPEMDIAPDFTNPGIYERCYIKRNEDLRIGDLQLKQIYYFYYKDRLSSIKIDYHSTDFHALLELLEAKYGRAYFGPNKMYTWENDQAWLNIVNHAELNTNNKEANITYVGEDEILFQSKVVAHIQDRDSDIYLKKRDKARLNDL
ncbi:hypothetical protein [Pontibacter burrus]|uniref:Uncharacterized protein n=1 Tax=Pontibacter burrus TaxID=2704466 RepID=A0A6B3M1E4_9BACT|nr:hypothetical protein [Pontibacter burrus]NEM99457.1 hypothetical protein [Pontibacter burrus]